jgi:hypothetical protein
MLASELDLGPSSKTLFKFVPVKLVGNNNTSMWIYAFLDDGSSVTLLEESVYKQLGYEGTKGQLALQWTQGVVRTHESYKTDILLSGEKGKKVHKLTDVDTVNDLQVPEQTVNPFELCERYPHLRGIPLSPMKNVRPQMLIGNKHAKLIVSNRTKAGTINDPVAIKTALGWTVFGGTTSLNICALNEVKENQSRVHVLTETGKLNREQFDSTMTNDDDEAFEIIKNKCEQKDVNAKFPDSLEWSSTRANQEAFPEEVAALTSGNSVTSESKRLLFTGAETKICTNSRVQQASLPNDAQTRRLSIIHSMAFLLTICSWIGKVWKRFTQPVKHCFNFVTRNEKPCGVIFQNALNENANLLNNRLRDAHTQTAQESFSEQDEVVESVHRRSQWFSDRTILEWIKRYLPMIFFQTELFTGAPPILIEPQKPREIWKKGRVTRGVHLGQDGTVRAADIILDNEKLEANRSVGCLAKFDLKVPSTLSDTVEDGPEDVGEPSNLDQN